MCEHLCALACVALHAATMPADWRGDAPGGGGGPRRLLVYRGALLVASFGCAVCRLRPLGPPLQPLLQPLQPLLQPLDALLALGGTGGTGGTTPLTLGSLMRAVVATHRLATCLALPAAGVALGALAPARTLRRLPSWSVLRAVAALLGLCDFWLLRCLEGYTCLLHLGRADPLPPPLSEQLRQLHARTQVAAAMLLGIAGLFTPANRLWLHARQCALREKATALAHKLAHTRFSRRAAAGVAKPPSPTQPRLECVVCLDEAATSILAPCGHKCVCGACAGLVFDGDRKCPLCQTHVESIVGKVYY